MTEIERENKKKKKEKLNQKSKENFAKLLSRARNHTLVKELEKESKVDSLQSREDLILCLCEDELIVEITTNIFKKEKDNSCD